MASVLVFKRFFGFNRIICNQRKFPNFPSKTAPLKSFFCAQSKQQQNDDEDDNDEQVCHQTFIFFHIHVFDTKTYIQEDDEMDIDLDALKNKMFEDFESEKDALSNNTTIESDIESDIENDDESEENNLNKFNLFDDNIEKKEKLSAMAQKFKKRIEFNESLKTASKIKSTKSVKYTSSTLTAGIPELMYDSDGIDAWVNYLRLYTYTPFTMGLLFVPLAIYGFPEWELFPKLMLGGFYMSTSAIFPYFSYRAVKDKVNRVWLAPDCNKLIVEKKDFFFQPYKKEYLIKDLRVLHKKGSERHCWFQCTRTKQLFLFVSELMQHSVWLQLLGVDQGDIADAKMRNIANDGKVTMFRGPNTG